MYDGFEPMGEALGLPPRGPEARHRWIAGALNQGVNVTAFAAMAEVVGHCFLVRDGGSSAEMAVFVRQEFRRLGIGLALVKTALEWGRSAGIRRVWTLTGSENRAALHLQLRCGFRLVEWLAGAAELEIELTIPGDACGTHQAA
jgi:GNAT superfamily N-acetyltransferase